MSDNVRTTEIAVIGGGPGGYPAAFHAAEAGKKVTLIDADPRLGGVCLNRGCIPSKALLHVAKLLRETREEAAHFGLAYAEPKLDLDKLREFVQKGVVGKLTGGIDMLAKARTVERLQAKATFLDSNTLQLEGKDAGILKFEKAIVAVGSLPAMPKSFQIGDPRVMDSTGALALPDVPKKLLVIGGGYIGLEMGTVYAMLGSKVTVVEGLERILNLADPDLVAPLEKRLRAIFEAIYVNTKVAGLRAGPGGITASLEGKDVPSELTFDRVLVSVGRRPNSAGLGMEKTKAVVNQRGFIETDKQCRTADPNILAIGDIAGEPMLAHKATAEARVAVETLLGQPAEFNPRAIPAVVFTDPEIAWTGYNEVEAKAKGVAYEVQKFPWGASGRAVTLGRVDGLTKFLVHPETKRILGVGIVGVGAGEMIAESTLAIEMGAVARDIAETIHAHPTLSETVMEAGELVLGHATHIARPKSAAKH
jgi:dihydrolipoamide dehydrogenase